MLSSRMNFASTGIWESAPLPQLGWQAGLTLCSSKGSFDDIFEKEYLEKFENLIHDEKFVDSKNIFIQWIGENRGHLPGMVLNQYKVPIQSNIDSLKNVISLDLVDSDENEKFKDLLNEYLKFENEFLENLI